MTLRELNAKNRDEFIAALGWVFEDSAWVAERAWEKRPFESLDGLHGVMTSAVAAAAYPEQLALLRAHPDLGSRAGMSNASTREQIAAGLDRVTRDEQERLRALNAAYREKFGFPFLYAVKGSTTRDVLDAIERRLASTREDEHLEALRQVYRIARFRLEELMGERRR